MRQDAYPIVLVVSSDAGRLHDVRSRLRAVGILTSGVPTVDSALALLRQVAMDGCVLCHPVSAFEAQRLHELLEVIRPGAHKLYVREHQAESLSGWVSCPDAELSTCLAALLARRV